MALPLLARSPMPSNGRLHSGIKGVLRISPVACALRHEFHPHCSMWASEFPRVGAGMQTGSSSSRDLRDVSGELWQCPATTATLGVRPNPQLFCVVVRLAFSQAWNGSEPLIEPPAPDLFFQSMPCRYVFEARLARAEKGGFKSQ